VLTFLFNALWQLPLLFAAAWVGARLLRRAPAAYRHRVWVAALALGVLVPFVGTLRPSKLDVSGLVARAAWTPPSSSGASSLSGAKTPPAPSQVSPRQALRGLAYGYAALLSVLALRLARSWRKSARIVARAQAAPPGLAELARELGAATELRVSPEIAAPMTFGVHEPVIVLPEALSRAASPTAVRGVLVHELAHVQRRDCALNLLCELLALPLAFHPSVRTLRRRIAGARESACDEAAAAVVGARDYADLLLEVATAAAQRPRLVGALGVLDGDFLEDRMKRILDTPARLGRRRALALLALAVATLGLVGRAAAGAALQVTAEPGPDEMVGVWKGVWAEGDQAGKPAAGIEIVLTPNGPAIDLVLYRYKMGSAEPPQLDRPPVVSHRIEKGVLHFRTRVAEKDSGPAGITEADWAFSVVAKDSGELRVTLPKLAAERAAGKDVPPPPPPLAMKRVKS
jgi:beta-lactamase regulating signal transducer with metallopeptidase domain